MEHQPTLRSVTYSAAVLLQALAHWALKTPGYKKTDEPSKPEEAEYLEKFKGEWPPAASRQPLPLKLNPGQSALKSQALHSQPSNSAPAESAYKCLVQVLLISVLLSVGWGQPWFTNSRLFWSDCTGLPCEGPVSLGERFVYCLELGFYLQVTKVLSPSLGRQRFMRACVQMRASPWCAGAADAVPVGGQAQGPVGQRRAPRGHHHPHRLLLLPQVSREEFQYLVVMMYHADLATEQNKILLPLQPDACGRDGAGVPRGQRHFSGGGQDGTLRQEGNTHHRHVCG